MPYFSSQTTGPASRSASWFGYGSRRNSCENGSTVETGRLNIAWSLAISPPAGHLRAFALDSIELRRFAASRWMSPHCDLMIQSSASAVLHHHETMRHFAGFTGDCHLLRSAV